jgi:hypothetical protein
MPQRIPALQLPLGRTGPAREANRQVALWAAQVVSVVNSLSADPGLKDSGNAGSAVTTLSFSGSGATVAISALMHFVSGGQSLATIIAPRGFTGAFYMIARNSFTLVGGGNIIVPGGSMAVKANQLVPMVFDGRDWYASVPMSSRTLNVKIITHDDSPYAVAPEDDVIIASAGTDADTMVLLPAASGSARLLDVKKADANPYNVGLDPAGTDSIDDAAGPFNILVRYASYTIIDYAAGKWGIL